MDQASGQRVQCDLPQLQLRTARPIKPNRFAGQFACLPSRHVVNGSQLGFSQRARVLGQSGIPLL